MTPNNNKTHFSKLRTDKPVPQNPGCSRRGGSPDEAPGPDPRGGQPRDSSQYPFPRPTFSGYGRRGVAGGRDPAMLESPGQWILPRDTVCPSTGLSFCPSVGLLVVRREGRLPCVLSLLYPADLDLARTPTRPFVSVLPHDRGPPDFTWCRWWHYCAQWY